jgi:hypothetical protein
MLLTQELIITNLTSDELRLLAVEAEKNIQIMQSKSEVFSLINIRMCSLLIEQIADIYSLRYYDTYVYTPMGSAVYALQMQLGDELTPAEIAATNTYFDATFPYATRIYGIKQYGYNKKSMRVELEK